MVFPDGLFSIKIHSYYKRCGILAVNLCIQSVPNFSEQTCSRVINVVCVHCTCRGVRLLTVWIGPCQSCTILIKVTECPSAERKYCKYFLKSRSIKPIQNYSLQSFYPKTQFLLFKTKSFIQWNTWTFFGEMFSSLTGHVLQTATTGDCK